MTQEERLDFLIQALREENPVWRSKPVPQALAARKSFLRSLMNVRLPAPVPDEVLAVQDAYLQEEARLRGIVDPATLPRMTDHLLLWQGDITRLATDAIVNAANSELLGCFIPCHNCIDNCIHSAAGMQMRLACARLMDQQGHSEPTGTARITRAWNLPCRYVRHTVGPIVNGPLTEEHRRLLASCYRSCLELARQHHLRSIAFCCISTGVFGFPADQAAAIAVATVQDYLAASRADMDVVFNVFKDADHALYQQILQQLPQQPLKQ